MRGASWAPALGVSLLAGAVVGACAGSTSAPRPSAVEDAVPVGGWASPPGLLRGHDAEDVRDGPALYARYCELCHGPQRQGYAADNAPSLRSPELMAHAPDAYL